MKNEMLEKAMACKSTEEFLALAKENGMELPTEAAEEYLQKLHGEGELSDDALADAAGGFDQKDYIWTLGYHGCELFERKPNKITFEGRYCCECQWWNADNGYYGQCMNPANMKSMKEIFNS